MRKFRIFIQDDETDETILEYPIPTAYQHNGFGGGTETPLPTREEQTDIKNLMTHLMTQLKVAMGNTGKFKTASGEVVKDDINHTFSSKCEDATCGYTAYGKTQNTADANLRLHRKYKHDGAKVGSSKP